MAENYTIKSFGLNIIPSGSDVKKMGENVEKAIGTLWDPVLDYLKENDNIFSGEVAREIEKTNIQTLNLGMAMRSSETERRLDEKF